MFAGSEESDVADSYRHHKGAAGRAVDGLCEPHQQATPETERPARESCQLTGQLITL